MLMLNESQQTASPSGHELIEADGVITVHIQDIKERPSLKIRQSRTHQEEIDAYLRDV